MANVFVCPNGRKAVDGDDALLVQLFLNHRRRRTNDRARRSRWEPTMNIFFDLTAQMFLDQLSLPDKEALRTTFGRLQSANTLEEAIDDFNPIKIHDERGELIYYLRAAPDLRILVKERQSKLQVIDIVRESQIDALRAGRRG